MRACKAQILAQDVDEQLYLEDSRINDGNWRMANLIANVADTICVFTTDPFQLFCGALFREVYCIVPDSF